MAKHVAVLMGGWSAEREVSLRSGATCAAALARLGYGVTPIDVGRDIATALTAACFKITPQTNRLEAPRDSKGVGSGGDCLEGCILGENLPGQIPHLNPFVIVPFHATASIALITSAGAP